jgi:hypothetical protein
MRRIFRRYVQLSASQKRSYTLLILLTVVALLLYCLGLGGVFLRSRLVIDTALQLPPTFTATATPQATSPATAGPTGTPTATLPPTPTQRPIPTFTPTPESVNITVVITSTEGLTSTVVVSATVTPTPVLTPTVTITAEASLVSPTQPESTAISYAGQNARGDAFCSTSQAQEATQSGALSLAPDQHIDAADLPVSATGPTPTLPDGPVPIRRYG